MLQCEKCAKFQKKKFTHEVFSTSGANCGSNNAKLFKEKESTELLKILGVKSIQKIKIQTFLACLTEAICFLKIVMSLIVSKIHL